MGVTSRPSSPLTEIESEDEAEASALIESEDEPEAPALAHPTSGAPSAAKRRRKAGAKKRRAVKRARMATSGHQPHAYAANPTTAMHHAEEQRPLRVSADAGNFPAAGSGSWVGLRNKGAKKKPWTVSELAKGNFTFVEWDGV